MSGQITTTKKEIVRSKSIVPTDDFLDKEHHLKKHSLIFCHVELSIVMRKIMAIMFTKMELIDWYDDDGNEASPVYEFTSSQIAQFLGYEKTSQLSSLLKNPCQRLSQTSVGITSDEDTEYFNYIPLLSRCSYQKGILTIVPNYQLRDHYIIKSQEKHKGHANIDNKVLVSLQTSYAMILFEWLCRFQDGRNIYDMKLSNIMKYFGILDANGNPLKPTFKSPKRFLTRILEPAIEALSKNDALSNKLKFKDGEQGKLGYSVISKNIADWRIRLEYYWLDDDGNSRTEERNKLIAFRRLNDLMVEQKTEKEKGKETPLEVMKEMEVLFIQLNLDKQALAIQKKIKDKEAELAKAKIQAEKNLAKNMESFCSDLDAFLDEI
ncbi:replication initiation protein [Photobacterium damselae]|nr:replication initiation protein [Photobacterium damselae]